MFVPVLPLPMNICQCAATPPDGVEDQNWVVDDAMKGAGSAG